MNKKIIILGLVIVIIGLFVKTQLGTSGDLVLTDEQLVTAYCEHQYGRLGLDYKVYLEPEYGDCNYIGYRVHVDDKIFTGCLSREYAYNIATNN